MSRAKQKFLQTAKISQMYITHFPSCRTTEFGLTLARDQVIRPVSQRQENWHQWILHTFYSKKDSGHLAPIQSEQVVLFDIGVMQHICHDMIWEIRRVNNLFAEDQLQNKLP